MGKDKTIIDIFAANSIFDAIEEEPASLQIWEPNSAIYAIPIILKTVEIYRLFILAFSDKSLKIPTTTRILSIIRKKIIIPTTILI